MKQTSLVIMAAGIGSRFGGGIKQLEPVGPNGEIIMDYSIHDALEAGFDRIIFVIRHDLEEDFKEVQEKIRLKGRVIRILSVAILVLTAAAVILGGIFVIDTFSFSHGQYKESIGKGERPENSAILQTY